MEQFFLESLEYVKNEIVRNRYSKLLHKCVHCAMNFYELMSRGYTKNRNCVYREYGPQL